MSGSALPFHDIRAFVEERIAGCRADLMIVEGVGGLMSPIADAATSLDLLLATGGENILVIGSYLGAISHGLTALEVLRARGRPPLAVVVSERGRPEDPAFDRTMQLLAEHLADMPLVAANYMRCDWAGRMINRVVEQMHSRVDQKVGRAASAAPGAP